jgi:plasmid rolling circle replication initiator protein Rep
MQAWGSGVAMHPPNFAVSNVAFVEPYAHLLNHNKVWPSLEDTLQETCKISQPSKPMQKWVKETQTSLMSFDAFT